jgi:hypothetical protein
MKTLTPQQIVDLGPCEGYDLKYVTELFDNKKSMTYLEILDTDKIPLTDIIWVFCQPTVLDDDIKKQWLEIIVTRAITNCALHCGVDEVEKWAKNWLSGKDKTFNAARNAADAAHAAVHAAAHAAIAYAAHAAYTVARTVYAADAAADAYGAYSTYGARNNEYKQQIQDLKNILQGEM